MSKPFISICIPAFKRTDFLIKLLDSISIQVFKDFEVIITDDSPTREVEFLCESYKEKFKLQYFKNKEVLGTPENWNEAIRKSEGEWIKLMHDDDWFSSESSLECFANAAKTSGNKLIFSEYTNFYYEGKQEEKVSPSFFRLWLLKHDTYSLLSKNIVGPPSVTLHKNDKSVFYDNNIKWLVDIEYYIRRLNVSNLKLIRKNLIHVGISDAQVTKYCHSNPEIEIAEYLYFLHKTGCIHLRNILVYDAWWRLLRNLHIRTVREYEFYAKEKCPEIIKLMLSHLNRVSKERLKVGLVSKFFMTLSYFRNRRKIK